MSAIPTPSLVAEIRKDTQARVPLKQRATGMGARELAGHRHGLALLHVLAQVRGDIEARFKPKVSDQVIRENPTSRGTEASVSK